MEQLRCVRGIGMALLLYLSSTLGTFVMVTPIMALAYLDPPLARRIMDFLIKLWFLFCVALYELVMGVRIVVVGRPPLPGTSSLVLSNHPTRLDWLFLMSYFARQGDIGEYRITLKDGIRKVPLAGWAMQAAGFMFLKRAWATDQIHISDGINYFAKTKAKPQFLLFPEGTDLSESTKQRSNTYAAKEGYPLYEYVLHPRTTGFKHFVREMHKGQILDSIVDVTIAYPKNTVKNELQVLKGEFPRDIHFLIQDHPIETVPTSDDEELDEWLRNLWKQKEERLRKYYSETPRSFPETENGKAGSVSKSTPTMDQKLRIKLYAVMVFWLTFFVLVFTSLAVSQIFRWYFAVTITCYVIASFGYGGADKVLYLSVAR